MQAFVGMMGVSSPYPDLLSADTSSGFAALTASLSSGVNVASNKRGAVIMVGAGLSGHTSGVPEVKEINEHSACEGTRLVEACGSKPV